MKITFVGHASILIEVDGISILSDPWWRGPCFGAQWWNYPAPSLCVLENKRIDYVYISHGHNDHFHPGTLKTLNRDVKVLVSKELGLASAVRELGLDAFPIRDDQEITLAGNVRVRLMQTYSDDTLLAVSDGRETCVNLNDALHAAPSDVQDAFIGRLKTLYPEITYAFCGYGVASHFPNCYVIPGKDPVRTAGKRQQYFNEQWVKIMHGLQPRYGFPFAADVAFFEHDLFWSNEAVHNCERPVDTYRAAHPTSTVTVCDIAPGFVVENGQIANDVRRAPASSDAIRRNFAEGIARANRYGSAEEEGIRAVMQLLEENLAMCRGYLLTYDGDWRFLIQVRNSEHAIAIEKNLRTIRARVLGVESVHLTDYDVIYTARLAYLKRSLTDPYGHEILFVGSGGIFEYVRRADVRKNLHRELSVILKKHEVAPASRYGDQSKWMYRFKSTLKAVIGKKPRDLYDLEDWTVFRS